MTQSQTSISAIIYGVTVGILGVLFLLNQGPDSDSYQGQPFIWTLIGLALVPAVIVVLRILYSGARKQYLPSLKPVVYIVLFLAIIVGAAMLFLFALSAVLPTC